MTGQGPMQARMQEAVRRSATAAPAVPGPKRRRTSQAEMPEAHVSVPQLPQLRPTGLPTTAVAAPPRAAIPGVVAPGPALSRSATSQGNAAAVSVHSPWPVLPYVENVEYTIAHADSQPLTFHRSVSRPLADFLSAVMSFLGVQVLLRLFLRPPGTVNNSG